VRTALLVAVLIAFGGSGIAARAAVSETEAEWETSQVATHTHRPSVGTRLQQRRVRLLEIETVDLPAPRGRARQEPADPIRPECSFGPPPPLRAPPQ
jgi:hypothetical protein